MLFDLDEICYARPFVMRNTSAVCPDIRLLADSGRLRAGTTKTRIDEILNELHRRGLQAPRAAVQLLADSVTARIEAATTPSVRADIICGAARKAGIQWVRKDSTATDKEKATEENPAWETQPTTGDRQKGKGKPKDARNSGKGGHRC